MRTIIIADIHGRYQLLNSLLEKIQFRKQDDSIIFLGDMIDKGNESYEVIEYIKSLKREMNKRCIILLGEHEDQYLHPASSLFHLLKSTDSKTKESFEKHHSSIDELIEFLKDAKPFYEVNLYQAVHAGIIHEYLPLNDTKTLLYSKSIVKENQYNGKLTITGHLELKEPTYFDGSTTSILPYGLWKNLPAKGVFCIDTSGNKNTLTALLIKDSQYYLEKVEC